MKTLIDKKQSEEIEAPRLLIALTSPYRRQPVLLDARAIALVAPVRDGGSTINLKMGGYARVTESPEDVMDIMRDVGVVFDVDEEDG